jgi:acetylornithine deacetylase/succinyl-diaminopimelate desuccinylase-like protein
LEGHVSNSIDAVALTRALLRFDTINPTSTERACAEHLAGLLEGAGFTVGRHEFAPGRTSIVARSGPGSRPALCFAGHIDTVPLGAAAWSRGPFAGEVDGDRLYGRGASDMKSGVAAFVAAAIEAARAKPAKDLLLVIVAGEETGARDRRTWRGPPARWAARVRSSSRSPRRTTRSSVTRVPCGCGHGRAGSPRTARCRSAASTRFTRRRAP